MNAAKLGSAWCWMFGLALVGSSATTCSSDDGDRSKLTPSAGGSVGVAGDAAISAGDGGIAGNAESTGNSDSAGNTGTSGIGGATVDAAGAGGSAGNGVGGEIGGGGTRNNGAAGGPTQITSDNIGDLVFETYCDFLRACEPKLGPAFPTRERCLEFLTLGLVDGFNHPIFWAKGTSLYRLDKTKAEGCLSKLAGAACTDGLPIWESHAACYGRGAASVSSQSFLGNQLQHLLEMHAECQGALLGTLTQNACCDYRGGCGPGLYCDDSVNGSRETCQPPGDLSEPCGTRPCRDGLLCVNGSCTAPAQLDETCVFNNVHSGGVVTGSNCGAGLYCDQSQQTPRCANANKTRGTPCDCFDCAPGLYCDYQSNPSLCKSYVQENEPCTNSDQCAAGLDCIADACRKRVYLPIGSECSAGSDSCVTGIVGTRCLDDGASITRCTGPGLFGSPCDPGGKSGKTCAGNYDLTCDEVSRSCQLLPALGQICRGACADRVNVFCAYVNPADPTGTCRPRAGEGSSCIIKETEDAGSGTAVSSSSSVDSGCRLDLNCNSATKTCVARTRQSCL